MQDFDEYRRSDGSIDLPSLWLDSAPKRFTGEQNLAATSFLEAVEECAFIRSRQVTALAIATAVIFQQMAGVDNDEEDSKADVEIPPDITKDRVRAYKIISHMLDNPRDCEIYPTTEAFNKFEEQFAEVRNEALGWMLEECRSLIDKGLDPRKEEISVMRASAAVALNPVER